MEYKDYYQILGLKRDATAEEVKKAYRRAARKYHPDVSKEPNAEERFKEVQEAYEVLKDEEKRAAYDQLGTWQAGQEFRPPPDWEKHFRQAHFDTHSAFGGEDFSDFFSQIFGGAGGQARPGRRRGRDVEATVEIELNDALRGREVKLALTDTDVDAQGRVRRVPNTVTVRIPKGVADGQTLRVPARGGKGSGEAPDGDLYLHIRLKPHPLFRFTGHDLYLEVPITPWEAALGASVDIPTAEGRARLKIPEGIRPGQKLRLAGKGLPRRAGESPGDLYAVIQIVVPDKPSDRERELFEELSRASQFDPRRHF